MTRSPLFRLGLLCCAVLALPAQAQSPSPQIKPGWWQIDNKMTSPDVATDSAMSMVLQQLGNLPPEQRKQLESMAANNGMAMPTVGADGAVRITTCVTPEMAARRQIPTGQPGDCSSNNTPTADGMKVVFSCNNPKSSGEGKLTLQGDQAFAMQLNVVTNARGTPEQVKVSSTGEMAGGNLPGAITLNIP